MYNDCPVLCVSVHAVRRRFIQTHTGTQKRKKRKCFYALSFQADPAQRAYVHSYLLHRAFWVFQLKLHCRDGRNPLFHVLLNYSTKYRGCVLDVIYGKQPLETKRSASLFKSAHSSGHTHRHKSTQIHIRALASAEHKRSRPQSCYNEYTDFNLKGVYILYFCAWQ